MYKLQTYGTADLFKSVHFKQTVQNGNKLSYLLAASKRLLWKKCLFAFNENFLGITRSNRCVGI